MSSLILLADVSGDTWRENVSCTIAGTITVGRISQGSTLHPGTPSYT